MKEFKKVDKVFIKSNNTTNKIFNRYLYCLIPFILIIIISSIILNDKLEIINLLKSLSLSTLCCSITQFIFNKLYKKNNITKIFLDDNILTISIILGLFAINTNYIIIIISSIITIIVKNCNKNILISSSLYGILIIGISNYLLNIDTPLYNLSKLSYIGTYSNIVKEYGNIINYIIYNKYYLSFSLSFISFIYLFLKKSIKYNIIISYILTFSFIILFIGIFNNMNIWYLFFQLTTGNILFLSVFCLADYPNSPITTEGQILYGIILGIITSILRFIIPDLSVVITFLLGQIILVKYINKISIKIKYNKKIYHLLLSITIILATLTLLTINVLI